jgi:hypothetical protein
MEPRASLLLNEVDACSVHVRPLAVSDVSDSLAGVEQERKRGSLKGSKLPACLEDFDLGVGPGVVYPEEACACLRASGVVAKVTVSITEVIHVAQPDFCQRKSSQLPGDSPSLSSMNELKAASSS